MKLYSIHDIVSATPASKGYCVQRFQDAEDPEVEWPHRHSYYSIVWFTQGSGINVVDFNEYEIKPGRAFFISPKQVHNWNYSIDCQGYFIIIEEYLLQQWGIRLASDYADVGINDKAFLEQVLERMILYDGPPDGAYERDRLAIAYFCSLIHPNSAHPSPAGWLVAFKQLVSSKDGWSLSIEQVLDKLHVSAEDLHQICMKESGLSPKQLQLDLKMTEAKRLLLYSELNASEIAYRIGFEDASYFSRIFKKKTSYSPSLYREKYQKLPIKS